MLRKIQRRAHYLDKGFYVCGIRFGWTFLIGLIPGAGDIVDATLNYTLVLRPSKHDLDLPDWLVRKMVFNNVVSAGVGLIPIAGDIVLAMWKANSRNAKLVEEFLRVKGEENMANGMPNLTPYTDERGRTIDHPAQPAAREVARGAGAAGQDQDETVQQSGVNAGGAGAAGGSANQTQGKRKWWGGKNAS